MRLRLAFLVVTLFAFFLEGTATADDSRISELKILLNSYPVHPKFGLVRSGEGGMAYLSGLLPQEAFSTCGGDMTFQATVLRTYYSKTRNYLAALDVISEEYGEERLWINVDAIAELPMVALGHLSTFLKPGAVRTFSIITCGMHAFEYWPYAIKK